MATEKELEELRKLEEEAALRFILSTKKGRRWLLKHLNDCGLFLNPYTGQREHTDFNCGRQGVAQDLLTEINRAAPNAFALMINEAQNEKDSYDNASHDRNSSTNNGNDNNDYRNGDGEYDPFGEVLR